MIIKDLLDSRLRGNDGNGFGMMGIGLGGVS